MTDSWPNWRTVGRLGSGSFGTVYEIERNNNGIIEKAALKVITIPRDESEVNDLRMKQMSEDYITSYYSDYKNHVLREYENMSKLHGCRNVVQCNDFKAIPHDDGIGWDILIKMELLTPLQNRLEGPFDEDDVIELGKDICKALVACSKEGITHRDIKPQNIFLSENGDYKLGDFGVARTLSGTTRSASRGVGTHDYMAPEVKNSEHYSNKADICSLGIVLYMLLNERRLPFEPLPPKLPRADYDYAAHRFRGEELPAPKNGRRSLKKIVLKACAFDPKDRYQSAEEMLHDLTDVGMGRKPSSFLPKHNPDKPNPGYSPPGDKPEDPLHGDDEGVPGDTSQPHGSTGTDDVFRGGKKPGTEGVFGEKEKTGTVGVFDGKDQTETTRKDPPNHWGRIVLITLCSIAILAVCYFNIHKWTSESEKTKIEAPVITSIELNSDCHPVLEWTPVDNAVTYYIVSADVIDRLSKIEHISKNYLEKTSATSATVDWSFNCNEFTRGGKDYRIQIGAELSNGKYIISSPETVFVPEHFHDNMHNLFRLSDDHKQLTISGKGRIHGADVPDEIRYTVESIVLNKGILPFGSGNDSNFFSAYYPKLKSVTLPEGLESIPDCAFYSHEFMDNLVSVKIPDGVKSIGEAAFSNLHHLNKINIPQSVTSIGESCFNYCGLKDIKITGDGITIGKGAFSWCSNLEDVSIISNGGTVNIGSHAFYNCEKLKNVSIEGLKEIKEGTFGDCVNLKTFDLKNITSIGREAFDNTGLTRLELPSSLEEIEQYAFRNCNNLTHVTIPSNVSQVRRAAFQGCKSLQTIVVSEGVKYIDDYAFYDCGNLISVSLPKSVRYLGNGTFNIYDESLNIYYAGTESQFKQIAQDASYYPNVYYNTTYLYQ